MVQKLLGENPIDPKLRRWCGNATMDLMVDASTWPDDVRNERKNGPWHYIDIPRGKHKGDLTEYCGADGCVTRAIEEQRAILKDKSADPLKRAEAIRYLIHFVGDLHQPLHAINNADNGGNCVPAKFFRHDPLPNPLHPEREDYSPNLHQIWDTEIVERDMEISNPFRYADELERVGNFHVAFHNFRVPDLMKIGRVIFALWMQRVGERVMAKIFRWHAVSAVVGIIDGVQRLVQISDKMDEVADCFRALRRISGLVFQDGALLLDGARHTAVGAAVLG